MTPPDVLLELLERVGASRKGVALVSEEELNQWPAEAVRELKAQKLLVRASPAMSVICPGCEWQCTMLVHKVSSEKRGSEFFIICDKPVDISRVHISAEQLGQWHVSLSAIASLVADLLGCVHMDASTTSSLRREVGLLKSRKHSSHIVLVANGGLNLQLAGHTVALSDFLTLEGASFRLDRQALLRLIDSPVAGGGDIESAAQRRARLVELVREERAKGNKAFLKTVAANEGISISRLKQLLPKSAERVRSTRASY